MLAVDDRDQCTGDQRHRGEYLRTCRHHIYDRDHYHCDDGSADHDHHTRRSPGSRVGTRGRRPHPAGASCQPARRSDAGLWPSEPESCWLLDEQGVPADEPFLDLRDRVNSGGIEQGFLGMAFHPGFADNGRFFAYYYKQGIEQTQLSEFRVSQDPNLGDPSSEIPLLTFDKPTTRHNGGMLQFGPDQYLWMSLGEGGAASVNSQDPNRLLSSILRLDVDSAEPYGIPDDNPFANGGGAPEVWAKGLRNPWRFSIDRDLIYIGDVGHEDFEEIDVVATRRSPLQLRVAADGGDQLLPARL